MGASIHSLWARTTRRTGCDQMLVVEEQFPAGRANSTPGLGLDGLGLSS